MVIVIVILALVLIIGLGVGAWFVYKYYKKKRQRKAIKKEKKEKKGEVTLPVLAEAATQNDESLKTAMEPEEEQLSVKPQKNKVDMGIVDKDHLTFLGKLKVHKHEGPLVS